MGSSKTKQVTDTQQHQTAAPPTWTAPGLADAAAAVTSGIGQIPQTHYSGPQIATMDPAALAAIQHAWGATAANAGDLSGWMQGMLPQLNQQQHFTTALPSTDYSLAPKQDLQGVIAASIDPVQKMLMEQILPSITNSALSAGAYSGDRAMRVLPTDAVRNATESMQRIASQLGYEDYQNYENRRLQAYQATTGAAQTNYQLEDQRQAQIAADQLARLSLTPDFVNSILHTQASQGDLLNMSAQLGKQEQQLGYNDAISRDQYASHAPFMGLDTASQLLAMLSGNWGTQDMTGHSQSVQTTTPSLASQLIQGAIGVGSMAAGFPGIGGALGLGGAASTPAASSLFSFNPLKPFGT